MRTLILHNDTSGYGSDAIYLFQRSLMRHGDTCELYLMDPVTRALPSREHLATFDVVVISSGDSTLASTLGHLAGLPAPVCVFPSGTANLFFMNLGNSPEPASIARACRVARTISCDLGRMTWMDEKGCEQSAYFSLMAGTGFDAELMRAALPNKSTWGQAAYFFAALEDPNPPVVEFTVTVDGETHTHAGIACMVANTAMIQGDIEIVPDSTITDGLLDVIILETPDAVTLVRPLIAAVLDPRGKKIGRPHIVHYRGAQVAVTSNQPIPLQIDGDVQAGHVMGFTAQALAAANNVIIDTMSRYFDGTSVAPRFPVDAAPTTPEESLA
jgi:diacylglycerol kinase family enzyme